MYCLGFTELDPDFYAATGISIQMSINIDIAKTINSSRNVNMSMTINE